MRQISYTHCGWWWFCPVLWGEDGFEGCTTEPRYCWCAWLFPLAEAFEQAKVLILSAIDAEYEHEFAFYLKPLESPVIRLVEPA